MSISSHYSAASLNSHARKCGIRHVEAKRVQQIKFNLCSVQNRKKKYNVWRSWMSKKSKIFRRLNLIHKLLQTKWKRSARSTFSTLRSLFNIYINHSRVTYYNEWNRTKIVTSLTIKLSFFNPYTIDHYCEESTGQTDDITLCFASGNYCLTKLHSPETTQSARALQFCGQRSQLSGVNLIHCPVQVNFVRCFWSKLKDAIITPPPPRLRRQC